MIVRKPRRPHPTFSAWDTSLVAMLADTSQPSLHAQPIVDLARGTVVGFELLSRFAGEPKMGPDKWFEAATATGYACALEARVFERALELRANVPSECFVTVNVSPEFLGSEEFAAFFEPTLELNQLVIEVTENERVDDYASMLRTLARCRERGALVAVDDAGAGYASLQHVLGLRPDLVKLDRALISNIDQFDAKRAVVEMLGDFTSRIDAWLLAEGIETEAELEALSSLGVPLGQGYFLARPAAGWPALQEGAKAVLGRAQDIDPDALVGLMERRPSIGAGGDLAEARALFASMPERTSVAVLDELSRPLGVLHRSDVEEGRFQIREALLVSPALSTRLAAQRAMLRPRHVRFDDLVCRDARG